MTAHPARGFSLHAQALPQIGTKKKAPHSRGRVQEHEVTLVGSDWWGQTVYRIKKDRAASEAALVVWGQ